VISEIIQNGIRDHALRQDPEECCGVIAGGKIFPAENLAHSPFHYVMDPNTLLGAQAHAGLEYFYHSHVEEGPDPSPIDKKSCDSFGLPMIIYSVKENAFKSLSPRPLWHCLLETPWVASEA